MLLTTQYMEEAEHLAHQIVGHGSSGGGRAWGTALLRSKDQLEGAAPSLRGRPVGPGESMLDLVSRFGTTTPRVDRDLKRVGVPIKGGAKVLIDAGRALEDDGIELEDLGIRLLVFGRCFPARQAT